MGQVSEYLLETQLLVTSLTQDTNERSSTHPRPRLDIDVLFAGPTGVGKSSLVNMIRAIPDHSEAAAKVSHYTPLYPRRCTAHTTFYPTSLEAGVHCRLWDTPGLDYTADIHSRYFVVRLVDQIRQSASQQTEPAEASRDRTGTKPIILVWCIDTTTAGNPDIWQQFRKVYVEYRERKVMTVIVFTQSCAYATWLDSWSRSKLIALGLPDCTDIPLLMVRRHHGISSPEYIEDSKALRSLLSQLTICHYVGISLTDLQQLTVPDINQGVNVQDSIRRASIGR